MFEGANRVIKRESSHPLSKFTFADQFGYHLQIKSTGLEVSLMVVITLLNVIVHLNALQKVTRTIVANYFLNY